MAKSRCQKATSLTPYCIILISLKLFVSSNIELGVVAEFVFFIRFVRKRIIEQPERTHTHSPSSRPKCQV